MKTFILALIIVALIAGFVVVDVHITDKITDNLTQKINNMPEQFTDDEKENIYNELSEFTKYWESTKKYLVSTVNYQYITSVNSSLEYLTGAVQVGDDVDYCSHRKALLLAIDNLHKFGSITAEVVF